MNNRFGFVHIFIIVIIALVILAGGYLVYIQYQPFANVEVLSPEAVGDYKGKLPSEYTYENYVELDPTFYGLGKYGFNLKLRNWAIPISNNTQLAFYHTPGVNYQSLDSVLVLVNKRDSKTTEYPFPEKAWWGTTNLAKIGENLFIHYLVRDDSRNFRKDYFYTFDVEKKTYTPIHINGNASDISKSSASDIHIVANPNASSTIFGLEYCSAKDFLGECRKHSIALSNSKEITKFFDVDFPFTLGWKDNVFFVNNYKNVYVIRPDTITWDK